MSAQFEKMLRTLKLLSILFADRQTKLMTSAPNPAQHATGKKLAVASIVLYLLAFLGSPLGFYEIGFGMKQILVAGASSHLINMIFICDGRAGT